MPAQSTVAVNDNQPTDIPAPTSALTMEEAESLTNELKHLLVRHEFALEQEGIRKHIETMERWMETYRRGLAAAQKLSDHAPEWLGEVRAKLKLASEEIHRLESEGGNTASDEHDQTAHAEDLLNAIRKVDALVPNIEQLAHPKTAVDATKA